MSQENIYSQTSTHSQNDIGQQTLEDIKTRSEIIIKQKCKDDFKLNNLQKDHQDFQKLIDEKNQQISEAEKDYHYLENAFGQLEITRGSVKSDVDMIVKSMSEYYELFNDMKKSIQNIKNEFNHNKELIEDFSKLVQNTAVRNHIQEKLKDLKHKKKLLEDLVDSSVKFKDDKIKNCDNRKIKLSNLEKEEQQLIVELKILQNKDEELKSELEVENKLKEDLQIELNMKQAKYDALLQKFETDKLNNDKQIEDLELAFNNQREKISTLEIKLEELTAERKTQNSTKEEAKHEVVRLEKNLCELQNNVEKQEEEGFKYRKMIEDLRTESSQIIVEKEKQLQNLNEKLNSINTSNDQIQNNIINDKKILDDLKHQEDMKKKEINSLQSEIKDLMKNIHDSEIKYKEIIDEYNIEINEFQAQKQQLLDKKEELLLKKDGISKMISDLQLKKMKCINESTQIEAKQNVFISKINEDIANLRNVLVTLEEDCENMKNSYDMQYEEISLKFKERKNELLENTNQYKERMEIIEHKADEIFKIEKNKYLEDQTKMELQISEYNAAIDNLQGELKKIVTQVNSENNTKIDEVTPLKVIKNILKQNGPEAKLPEIKHQKTPLKVTKNILKQNGPEAKLPEIKNKKAETKIDDKDFEWTTDEEEYKKSQKLKATQSQIAKNEKSALKIQKKVEMSQKKKESTKQNIKKMIIDKISSTDSEFDWIQPLSKIAARKTK